MLMRKWAIYEFGCRNILYLMFESLSIYCLYQKKLVEITIFEIVKPYILLRKSSSIALGNKDKETGLKYSS